MTWLATIDESSIRIVQHNKPYLPQVLMQEKSLMYPWNLPIVPVTTDSGHIGTSHDFSGTFASSLNLQ